jgi:triosephosphate isomerase
MRQKLVIGNWKMNGSLPMCDQLLTALHSRLTSDRVSYAVCPPFVYLSSVKSSISASRIALGAQDVSCHASGAYTGETAASMLKEIGCQYVLIGHSERRQYHRESDQLIAEKFVMARQAGLVPVVCIGETLAQREANETETVVANQLHAILAVTTEADYDHMVLAYEPVWAIGTGKTATPEQVEAVHAFLRQQCAKRSEKLAKTLKILYGGSVKPGNAKQLFALPNVDGGLIGGASLVADDFVAICQAAE